MTGTVSAILLASFLGSVHCAGMCGAFVCFYTGTAHGTAASALALAAAVTGGLVAGADCVSGAPSAGVWSEAPAASGSWELRFLAKSFRTLATSSNGCPAVASFSFCGAAARRLRRDGVGVGNTCGAAFDG